MLTGGISVPSTDTRISYAESDAKLMAVVWGDTQLCNYNPEREVNFVAACDDLQNSSTQIDALLVAGEQVSISCTSIYDSVDGHNIIFLADESREANGELKFVDKQ